jgi:parallel beta helix pectate lyase-like protein
MKRSHTAGRALASFAFIVVLATVAQAQLNHTWVAGDGNDTNPCTRDLPCQTFAAALTQTDAGGEINVKDAGDFGTVTIEESITIDGGGTFAGIPTSGVRINDAGSATPNTAVVTLRNLSINGAGQTLGAMGVNFLSGKALNIESCQIFNFSYGGVVIYGSGNVSIKNTSIFNTNAGVVVDLYPGSATVSLNGCNIEQNTFAGVNVLAGGYISIRNSVIQFNGKGVYMQASGSAVNIIGSQVNNNTTGVYLLASTTATIGDSTFISNSTNFANSNFGSSIKTFGNNQTETNPIPGLVTNLGLQ